MEAKNNGRGRNGGPGWLILGIVALIVVGGLLFGLGIPGSAPDASTAEGNVESVTGNSGNEDGTPEIVAEDAGEEVEPVAAEIVVVNDLPPKPKKGHPAPDFALLTLDGEEVRLSNFRGKPVIINFWASWCGPCRLEMPHLQAAHAEASDDLVVLGVNLTQREGDLADVPEFIEEFGVTFTNVLDADGDVASLYEVRGQPASVFVTAAGDVHMVFYGPVNDQFIQDRIAELM